MKVRVVSVPIHTVWQPLIQQADMVTLFWERSNFNLSSTSRSLSPLLSIWMVSPRGKNHMDQMFCKSSGLHGWGLFTGLSSNEKDQRVYTKKGKLCHVCIDHQYLCSAVAFGGNTWRLERDRWQRLQVHNRQTDSHNLLTQALLNWTVSTKQPKEAFERSTSWATTQLNSCRTLDLN